MPECADSTEVKDVVQSHMQTQKNDVPQEIIEVPIDLDFIPKLFDDFEEMEESEADSHNRENKENARGSDIVHDEAKYIDTLGSIEDCLTLFSHSLTNCDNCSKVAELLETNASKSVEPIMASTSVNTSVHGDQTLADSHQEGILSDDTTTEKITSGTSCDEKDLASCSTANEKAESREGVQKAAPICLTTDQQTDLLSAQDIQDNSTQKQDSGKLVNYDHSAQQVVEQQNNQTDGIGGATQTQLISKLPPVLTIQLQRYAPDRSKLSERVRFKEILHLGPFMDPRYWFRTALRSSI
jgi:ubiquitin carboxyl-terminal hydrolase 16/45